MSRMRPSRSSARARQMSWRWPTETFSPYSATLASSPPIARTARASCARSRTSHTRCSLCSPNGSRLERTVPEKSTGSCGIIDTAPRSCSRESDWMSRPSIEMVPSAGSTMRISSSIVEDLPEPVRPTTPTFAPAGTENETRRRASSSPGRYRMETPSKTTSPLCSHARASRARAARATSAPAPTRSAPAAAKGSAQQQAGPRTAA
mmetsp:Transcript_22487/g.57846  ORF Transcript_22487/g.57846 Transcript_22487/m.57846 type:complete len:206 (-) Transcript_22487:3817-4434(-)